MANTRLHKQFDNPSIASRNFYPSKIIKFYDDIIRTTVTKFEAVVDRWISDILFIHRSRLGNLLVGLDTEWYLKKDHNGYQHAAILQLCVGKKCLIFQLCHANTIPQSLVNFLANKNCTFVGVGIKTDVTKLEDGYGLIVSRTLDVAIALAEKYDDKEYKRKGLKRLAQEFLKVEMEKPKHITLSRWDNVHLSYAQVEYACIDAFVSFRLGIEVNKPRCA